MRLFMIFFSLVVLTLFVSVPVHAAGVVNPCDEASLNAALAGGGTVTFGCSGTITLTSTKTITANTVIDGSGQNVIISGGNARKIFLVNAGVTFEIRNITLSNANQDFGGAIENYGTTTASGVTFSNNVSHWGGAILNRDTGILTVTNSTFTGNSDFQSGGAVNTDGVATISNSTFSNNSAVGNGGALRVAPPSGSLTVTNSTFSNNRAVDGGALASLGGSVTATNNTFVGNQATGNGGAVFNQAVGASISSSTFSGNTAPNGNNIFVVAGTLNLSSSILHNGSCAGGGTLADGGNNLAFNSAGCPGANGDPMLGTLGNYGGATQTLPLQAGSAALDAYSAGCPSTDQRGIGRPQGAACDIGAYEAQVAADGSLIAPQPPAPDQCQEMLDPTFSAPVGWYCQVLMRNNVWISEVGTIPVELVNAGVIIAVELIYYDAPGHAAQNINTPHQVCLQGMGRFIFLDNSHSPRHIVELDTIVDRGYTCGFIINPGTVVLIEG